MYRVVLIDDERLIVKGLSTVVPWAELGCEVIGTAHDGLAGLDLIREEKPNIVFTDIRMPNMDGLTMIAAIHSEFEHIQTTVLTAYRDFDYAQKAISLGVYRYLLKPSNMDELVEAVKGMVQQLDKLPKEQLENFPESETAAVAGNYIVQSALQYMKEHCTEPHLTLTEVADHVYVSQWHLSKLLNRETKQGFFELLGGIRTEVAKKMLESPGVRIHEVAEATGYTDSAHFSKSFKKLTGMTPGEYRKQAMLRSLNQQQ